MTKHTPAARPGTARPLHRAPAPVPKDAAQASPAAGPAPAELRLSLTMVARALPFHAILSPTGIVLSTGATMTKLFPGRSVIGCAFLDLFELRSPGEGEAGDGQVLEVFRKLRLSPKGPASGLRLRGVALPLEEGRGLLVNLSFGIDVVRAVRQLDLSAQDFAATELTMELLYLAEANAAVRGEMEQLSHRLLGAREHAQEEAQTDPLTQLRNRRAADRLLARLCRERAAFSLMQIDLDYFKQVNDSLGHAAGDHVLQEVGRVLKSQARSLDCIARVGGDEFMMILPGLVDRNRLLSLGERVIEILNRPIPFQDKTCHISASIGFAIVPEGLGAAPAQVLSEADILLYAAKESGRSRVLGTVVPAKPARPG